MTLVSYPWMLDLLVGVILLACACIKGVKGIYTKDTKQHFQFIRLFCIIMSTE